jgi:hypothetical protein
MLQAPGTAARAPLFRFQARIAQGGMPLGDRRLNEVTVFFLAAGQVVCQERFTPDVRDSVLDLPIGAQPSCDLAQVLATSSDLELKVCIGGQTNCLKPVQLASVPYAVRANTAVQAQHVDSAAFAAVTRYATRATADRDAPTRNKIETGYIDFQAHSSVDGQGELRWVPLGGDKRRFHLTAKDFLTDRAKPLSQALLFADTTTFAGDLHVTGNLINEGPVVLAGLVPDGSGESLRVMGDSNVTRQLWVSGDATVGMALRVRDGATLAFGDNMAHVGDTGIRLLAQGRAIVLAPEKSLWDGPVRADHFKSPDGTTFLGSTEVGIANGLAQPLTVLASETRFLGSITFDEAVVVRASAADGQWVHGSELASRQLQLGDSSNDAFSVEVDTVFHEGFSSTGHVAANVVLGNVDAGSTAAHSVVTNGTASFLRPVVFSAPVTLPAGTTYPADAFAFGDDSVTHRLLGLTAKDCRAHGLVGSADSDLAFGCTSDLSLSADAGSLVLRDGAGAAELVAHMEQAGSLSLEGPAAYGMVLRPRGQTALTLREGVVTANQKIEASGALRVGGKVQSMVPRLEVVAGTLTPVAAGQTGSAAVACASDAWRLLAVDVAYSASASGQCTGVLLSNRMFVEATPVAHCSRTSNWERACTLYNDPQGGADLCFQVTARCARIH